MQVGAVFVVVVVIVIAVDIAAIVVAGIVAVIVAVDVVVLINAPSLSTKVLLAFVCPRFLYSWVRDIGFFPSRLSKSRIAVR